MPGKAVIPIQLGVDGWFRAEFMGEERTGTSPEELARLEAAIRFNGTYPWAAPRADIEHAGEDRAERDAQTDWLIIEELQRWIKLGDERFAQYGVQAVVMGGNDDPWSIEKVLDAATCVQNCDARILRVGNHELLSLGWSNVTPWHTEREAGEEELYARLKPLAEQFEDPWTAIFNIHVPPYDTRLDSACEVRESDLTLVYEKGAPTSSRSAVSRPADHRGVPAAAFAARPHSRVARSHNDGAHRMYQPRVGVQQRPAARGPHHAHRP